MTSFDNLIILFVDHRDCQRILFVAFDVEVGAISCALESPEFNNKFNNDSNRRLSGTIAAIAVMIDMYMERAKDGAKTG